MLQGIIFKFSYSKKARLLFLQSLARSLNLSIASIVDGWMVVVVWEVAMLITVIRWQSWRSGEGQAALDMARAIRHFLSQTFNVLHRC